MAITLVKKSGEKVAIRRPPPPPTPGQYCSRCGGPRPQGHVSRCCDLTKGAWCIGIWITAGEHEGNYERVQPLPPEGYWTGEERLRRARANSPQRGDFKALSDPRF